MRVRTVAYSNRTIGITVASVIALVLVGGAFALSGPIPFLTPRVNAESTHDLLVAYAAKDTDADGLPDWEEALYGTDPNNSHSVNATVLDGQAVAEGLVKPKFATATTTPVDAASIPGTNAGPQTVTDQFARDLFNQYLAQRGSGDATPEDIASFVEQRVAALADQHTVPNAYNQGQVRISGTGPDALLTYAADMEAAFNRHPLPKGADVMTDLGLATTNTDAAAIARLAGTGKVYAAIAQDMMKIEVPKEAASSHLVLANALMHLSGTVTDLSMLASDPIRSMLSIGNYPSQVDDFTRALTTLYTLYTNEGVSIDKGEPGSHFYGTLLFASQSTSSSKP